MKSNPYETELIMNTQTCETIIVRVYSQFPSESDHGFSISQADFSDPEIVIDSDPEFITAALR